MMVECVLGGRKGEKNVRLCVDVIHMYIYAYCVYIPTCATICLHMCICCR